MFKSNKYARGKRQWEYLYVLTLKTNTTAIYLNSKHFGSLLKKQKINNAICHIELKWNEQHGYFGDITQKECLSISTATECMSHHVKPCIKLYVLFQIFS